MAMLTTDFNIFLTKNRMLKQKQNIVQVVIEYNIKKLIYYKMLVKVIIKSLGQGDCKLQVVDPLS